MRITDALSRAIAKDLPVLQPYYKRGKRAWLGFFPHFIFFRFLECEVMFSFFPVFPEVCSTFTGECFNVKLPEFPLLLMFLILLHTIRTFSHLDHRHDFNSHV